MLCFIYSMKHYSYEQLFSIFLHFVISMCKLNLIALRASKQSINYRFHRKICFHFSINVDKLNRIDGQSCRFMRVEYIYIYRYKYSLCAWLILCNCLNHCCTTKPIYQLVFICLYDINLIRFN